MIFKNDCKLNSRLPYFNGDNISSPVCMPIIAMAPVAMADLMNNAMAISVMVAMPYPVMPVVPSVLTVMPLFEVPASMGARLRMPVVPVMCK
jgi:hypothetical protein